MRCVAGAKSGIFRRSYPSSQIRILLVGVHCIRRYCVLIESISGGASYGFVEYYYIWVQAARRLSTADERVRWLTKRQMAIASVRFDFPERRFVCLRFCSTQDSVRYGTMTGGAPVTHLSLHAYSVRKLCKPFFRVVEIFIDSFQQHCRPNQRDGLG